MFCPLIRHLCNVVITRLDRAIQITKAVGNSLFDRFFPSLGLGFSGVGISLLIFFLSLSFWTGISRASEEEPQKWVGVDKKVVERIAADHGRPPEEPVINTDQGDLLLFVFLGAGAVGGFAAGYYWHKLVSSGPSSIRPVMEKRD